MKKQGITGTLALFALIFLPFWLSSCSTFHAITHGFKSTDHFPNFFIEGHHFLPVDSAGLWDLFVPKYASYWKIDHPHKHHMFYRQCMLFVSFLQRQNPEGFKLFLIDLLMGAQFKNSFQTFLAADTMTLFNQFKNQLLNHHSHSP